MKTSVIFQGGAGKDCHCGNLGYDKYGAAGGCTTCNYQGQSYACGLDGGADWRIITIYKITTPQTGKALGCRLKIHKKLYSGPKVFPCKQVLQN